MRAVLLTFLAAIMLLAVSQNAVAKIDDARFEELKKRISASIKTNPAGTKSDISDIATDDSARAVEFLVSLASSIVSSPELVDAVQSAFNAMNSEEAKGAIAQHSRTASDYRMRIILVESLATKAGSVAISALIKAIDDSKEEVAYTAVRALGEKRTESAIEPLIVLMERLAKKKETGRLYNDARIALEKITGKKGLEEAQDWRNWYEAYKAGIVPGTPKEPSDAATSGARGEVKTVSFFGLTIDSRRILFVIDVSASMLVADPPPDNWVPDRELGQKGGTRLREDEEAALKKKREEELEKMKKDWEKERQRIYRVKKELLRVIDALPPSVKFNIVSFSDQISVWKSGLQTATAANKTHAKDWVEKWQAEGLTWTDDALKEAFKDKEADTIVLLSDGAPTHLGGEGTVEWGGHQDSKAIIEAIYKWVAENNKFRKVTIHTLGFEGANFEFMKKLAQDNNGICRDIP
jgi:hypothetical protein